MGEMTRAMTREPVAGQKGKMLSVKEIGDILSEPLRECGPTATATSAAMTSWQLLFIVWCEWRGGFSQSPSCHWYAPCGIGSAILCLAAHLAVLQRNQRA